jgi:heptosyltransferase-1
MKVLIVRVGAMGDVLHALPAVTALHVARPDWEIDWVVDPRWAPLLVNGEGHGLVVRRVHLAETKKWSKAPASPATLRSIFELRRALRGESYDLAVDMQGTLRSAVIGRMAGAGQFVGYSDPREAMAAKFYKTNLERKGRHVMKQGAALLGEACGVALEPAAVALPHEEWADNWAAEEVGDRQTCLLAASAGWPAKCWAVEKFGKLAVELKALGMDVVVNAPRKEDALAAAVVAASGGAARVVVCNVTGLIALLRRMTVVVGGDSGPTHLAAALGIPVVALFGPTDPERNGPRGPGRIVVLRDPASVTSYKRATAEDAGLAKISVGTVVEAVRGLL